MSVPDSIIPEATARYDPAVGIVHSCIKGLLTVELVEAYKQSLRQAVTSARRQSPQVLMLHDSSEGAVQSRETVDRLRAIGEMLRQPNDRVGLVVGSMLLKMQADRTIRELPNERTFRSIEEAKDWLIA